MQFLVQLGYQEANLTTKLVMLVSASEMQTRSSQNCLVAAALAAILCACVITALALSGFGTDRAVVLASRTPARFG